MAPHLWLFQLLRVAQQDKALSGRRAGQHIRQRHLPRLVDKQHVHRIHEIRARPEPCSRTEHICCAALQTPQCCIVRANFTNSAPAIPSPSVLCAQLTPAMFISPAAFTVSSRSLRITLWPTAVIPTLFPLFTSSQIMRAPVNVLPAPGGPWIGSTV